MTVKIHVQPPLQYSVDSTQLSFIRIEWIQRFVTLSYYGDAGQKYNPNPNPYNLELLFSYIKP